MVYIINLAPYVGVQRSTFIYHYMPALVYGELMAARLVETLVGPRYTPFATLLILGITGGVVLHFAPWIYATPVRAASSAASRLRLGQQHAAPRGRLVRMFDDDTTPPLASLCPPRHTPPSTALAGGARAAALAAAVGLIHRQMGARTPSVDL